MFQEQVGRERETPAIFGKNNLLCSLSFVVRFQILKEKPWVAGVIPLKPKEKGWRLMSHESICDGYCFI